MQERATNPENNITYLEACFSNSSGMQILDSDLSNRFTRCRIGSDEYATVSGAQSPREFGIACQTVYYKKKDLISLNVDTEPSST